MYVDFINHINKGDINIIAIISLVDSENVSFDAILVTWVRTVFKRYETPLIFLGTRVNVFVVCCK